MYTNVFQKGNFLCVRGIENGRRFHRKVDFRPTLWVTSKVSNATDKWVTLDGQTVYGIQPGSIRDTRDYVNQYGDVHGMDIYESPGNIYQFIAEQYPDEITWDPHDVVVFTVDIETETEDGFPDPKTANERVLLITIKDRTHKKIITFGLKPYTNTRSDCKYVYCKTEQDLFKEFMAFWQKNYPDAITGWNSSLFDTTYLYNRMCKVVGETLANKLSPWGSVQVREVEYITGKTADKVVIAGIASLDYLDLYKKFTYSAQESYKLDYIAWVELGEKKKENPGTSFKDFYTNYWDDFVTYNVHDVELVDKLDDKMKLMDLIMTMAYDAKVNYEDVFSPVKTWDIIIYNYLNKQKIVIPKRKEDAKKDKSYEGAYVKDPLVGKHHWNVSFDLNSLYPMLMVQYNLSPDTITNVKLDVSVDKLLDQSIDLSEAHERDLTVAANGWCFRKDKRGLLPTLAQHYYDQRVVSKKEMIKEKQELEKIKAEMERRGIV